MTYRVPTFESNPWAEKVRAEYRQEMATMTYEQAVADAMAQGFTRREAEHDASLPCGTCSTCKGQGVVMGGDEYQPCPACSLRAMAA